MTKTYRLDKYNYEVELGKFAQQADGAVWFKNGGTVILATVCSAPSQDFPGFFPLTVEYREQYAAAGKIPGGYFKREGKPSEQEVLTSRLIDRAIRPLFPEDYFDQVQVVVTVYSVDKEHSPSIIALVASSLALSISKIPFLGPIAAVQAGRIDGKWVMNPKYTDSKLGDAHIVVAGTHEGISMVEGSANELPEKDFVDILFKSHEALKDVVTWQQEIQKEFGVPKVMPESKYNFEDWRERADKFLTTDVVKPLYAQNKADRDDVLSALRDTFIKNNAAHMEQTTTPKSVVSYMFETVLKDKITELMFTLNKRVDGRAFDEIRPISNEVGLLPCTHGSALFKRGNTQALVTVTLGSGEDAQRTEMLMDSEQERGSFMLHYNFPPFSVGEVKFMRGPGRREIGHGNLASSALQYVRPTKEEFPYTIRVVADILESNGSTSMATTCGATMALMQAGVPLRSMVAGNAMGLILNDKGDFKILSDITGFEDAFGLMDFKVAGTDVGITAIQMDIKYKGGFAREVFDRALDQARIGRLHILSKMREVMTEPNKELSPLVPKVVFFKINTEKIGAVIGSGGKTIREITEVTGTSIDIEEDGMVKIYGGPESKLDLAIHWVKTLVGQIPVGEIFEGKIKRSADFGLFVELVPGVQGLVHISNIPREKQRNFLQMYNMNDEVRVEVLDYDDETGRISLRLLEK